MKYTFQHSLLILLLLIGFGHSHAQLVNSFTGESPRRYLSAEWGRNGGDHH